jgi:hypothetical protein
MEYGVGDVFIETFADDAEKSNALCRKDDTVCLHTVEMSRV